MGVVAIAGLLGKPALLISPNLRSASAVIVKIGKGFKNLFLQKVRLMRHKKRIRSLQSTK